MPYSSPLHILPPEDLAGSESTGEAFLLRLRKKLLAEYSLSNEPELNINGKAYTKDTIIKTIDVLLGNPDLPLHLYIFKNPGLLGFLEGKSARFDYAGFLEAQPPENILPGIYQLLTGQALSVFKRSVQARDFAEAQAMLLLLRQVPDHQSDEYYQVIYNSLENLRGLVSAERHGGLRDSAKQLGFMKTHAFSVFLNSLTPDFTDIINSLVADIINFMVAYQKSPKADRGFLYTLSTMLTKVKCDSELEALIKKNHQAFSAYYLGNDTKTVGSSGLSPGRIVYIILMVVVFGARILYTCDRNDSGYNSSFNPTYYPPRGIQANEPQLDEKLKEMREHCIYKDLEGAMAGLYTKAQPSLLQGKNPFSFLANADDRSLPDSSVLPLKLVNHTGYDLVVIRHINNHVHSNYIFKDSSLLYAYPKGYSISFYAGSDWLRLKDASAMQSSAFGTLKYGYENKFRSCPPNAGSLFSADYVINVLNKKAWRKKSPPVVELTGEFIKTGAFKNKTLQFAQLTYTVTAAP